MRCLGWISNIAALSIASMLSACGGSGSLLSVVSALQTEPTQSWTIFVYGHADHNLSPSLLKDMVEMGNATLGPHITVIVMADWSAGTEYAPGANYPSGTEWYRIVGNGQPPVLIGTEPEQNLDEPSVLRRAVETVFSTYKADRYGIVLWNHGGSWDMGFGHDGNDTPANPNDDGVGMSAAQAASSITNGLMFAGISGPRPLEFLSFDTCLMSGNEVAYEFRFLAKTYIASAEIDFGAGWDYTATLSHISANSRADAAEIAKAEVKHWNAHHSTYPDDLILRTQVALDMSKFDAYADAWKSLSSLMTGSATVNWLEVARKQFSSQPGYSLQLTSPTPYPKLRDSKNFLAGMSVLSSDTSVRTASSNALTALDKLVLAKSLGTLRHAQGGIHFEMPLAQEWSSDRRGKYVSLPWDQHTSWSKVVDKLQVQSDAVAPVVNTTPFNTTNPNASNPPRIQLSSADTDIAEAQILVGQTVGANVIYYGLIGAGLVEPATVYEFQWNGNLLRLSNGTETSSLYLLRWIAAGTDSQGSPVPAMFAIPGILSDSVTSYAAQAIVPGNGNTVSLIQVETNGQVISFPISVLKGTTFTPILYNSTSAAWMLASTISIPSTATPTLTVVNSAAAAGNYHFITTITDVWGNVGARLDSITVVTPFGI